MDRPILVGAVAYDARVVPIWEGMRHYLRETGVPIDHLLFSRELRSPGSRAAGPANPHRLEHEPGLGEGVPANGWDLPGTRHAGCGRPVHHRVRRPHG